MKELLLLMARYNKVANGKMMDCFRKVDEKHLKKDIGLYYKSIWGIFEHCLGGEMSMFGNVFRMYCMRPEAHESPLFEYGDFHGLNGSAGKTIDEALKTRSKMDELIIDIISDMDHLDKIETLELPNIKYEKPRYQLVMAMLTHATHHRGQVAAALDILHIDNDFSSMLGI